MNREKYGWKEGDERVKVVKRKIKKMKEFIRVFENVIACTITSNWKIGIEEE